MRRGNAHAFLSACLAAMLCWLVTAEAHEVGVHRGISHNAVDILDIELLNRYRSQIGQGSVDEDTFPQYCYHAYNPHNGRGFDLPCPGVVDWANIIASNAHDAMPILWTQALAAYDAGNLAGSDGAFHMLGRCIHLIQDMTSPAHTHSDTHIGGDDFELWGGGNFLPLLDLDPAFPADGSPESFVRASALLVYNATTWPGIIQEASPQPDTRFKRMFPTLTFHDGGFLGDDYWVIDNIGEFDEAGVFPPCIGSPSACDEWWPSDDDFDEDEGGPGGARRITGNFYVENAAGDDNRLAPAVWAGARNTRSLMRIYSEELYPHAISYSAGLLRTFADTVCPPPTADFTITDAGTGCAPHRVRFRDRSDGDSIDTWSWDFGDGATSEARHPVHIYTRPGSYIVTLTVSGDCGESARTIRDLVRVLLGSPAIDENGDRIAGECREDHPFHRGDANADGSVDISDPLRIFSFLFLGAETPSCLDSADASDDGGIDITDGVFLLRYLFNGAAQPPAPGPPGSDCGSDPDDGGDTLGCESYKSC